MEAADDHSKAVMRRRARAAAKGATAQAPAPQRSRPSAPKRVDFTAVVRKYETPLLRYVIHLTGQDAAEDVVQETFLRLHKHAARHGPRNIRSVRCWLFQVAHNLAVDAGLADARQKKAREHAAARKVVDLEGLDQLGDMVRRAACDRALEEMKKMPERQRQMLLLKTIQGMTLREISRVTGVTIGNVAYQINRALAELAKRLKEADVI